MGPSMADSVSSARWPRTPVLGVLERLRYGSSTFTQGDRAIGSVEIAPPRGAFLHGPGEKVPFGRRHVSLVSRCNENGFERSLPVSSSPPRFAHFPIAAH